MGGNARRTLDACVLSEAWQHFACP